MSRDTWFKGDPIDFLDGIERIADPEPALVYLAVIFMIYANNGPVPNNPTKIGAVTGLSRTKAARAVAKLVEIGRLRLVPDGLMDDRCADELERRSKLSATRAEAGSKGGRSSQNEQKLSGNRSTSGEKTAEVGQKSGETRTLFDAKPAENRGSNQAIASPRAREREQREERTPQPPTTNRGGFADLDDSPLTDAERAAMNERAIARAARHAAADDVDVNLAELIAQIMREARMVTPPMDTALVGGWVRAGADPKTDIMPIVIKLSASARGGVRGFRYFDQTIRDHIAAKSASTTTNIAHFRAIREKHERIAQQSAR